MPPSGIMPDPSKKVYCNHWIRTGECDYTVPGCRYKHEMPPIDKLRELGYRSEPRWYKDKQALDSRGQTWMERRKNQQREEETSDGEIVLDATPRAILEDPSNMKNAKLEAIFSARTFGKGDEDDKENQPPRERVERPTMQPVRKLINVEEPTSPSSPPPSVHSASSIASSVDHASTHSQSYTPPSSCSITPPSSPAVVPSTPVAKEVIQTSIKKLHPSIRRHSQISWPSDDEAIKASKQHISRRKAYPKKNTNVNTGKHSSTIGQTSASTPVAPPAKKFVGGLAKSRYAVAENDREKHTGHVNTNASQRNSRFKLKNAGLGGEVPDLKSQITEHTRAVRHAKTPKAPAGVSTSASGHRATGHAVKLPEAISLL
jgi:hypothetical protein